MIGVAYISDSTLEVTVDTDLDTLATALYVKVDDALKDDPRLTHRRPAVGIAPKLSDAELITLSVIQAFLGFTSETRCLRFAREPPRCCPELAGRGVGCILSGCAHSGAEDRPVDGGSFLRPSARPPSSPPAGSGTLQVPLRLHVFFYTTCRTTADLRFILVSKFLCALLRDLLYNPQHR
jgi:hypothetical protein